MSLTLSRPVSTKEHTIVAICYAVIVTLVVLYGVQAINWLLSEVVMMTGGTL